MREYILFDLDGTITDPVMGITNAIIHSLAAFGIKAEDRKALYPFIGPPLRDSYKKYYGFSAEQTEEVIAKYREYYSVKGLFENDIYPGIPEMLEKLSSCGAHIVLATSKPIGFSRRILEHYGLDKYFFDSFGSELDGTRDKKTEVIGYAVETLGIKDKMCAVMVGDRAFDMAGAAENGLDCVGALYGYGSREELTEAGGKHLLALCPDVYELTRVLTEMK